MKICRIANCNGKHMAHGLCRNHYETFRQMRKKGIVSNPDKYAARLPREKRSSLNLGDVSTLDGACNLQRFITDYWRKRGIDLPVRVQMIVSPYPERQRRAEEIFGLRSSWADARRIG